MAKHKKKRAHKTSKGLRSSISPLYTKLVRQARDPLTIFQNKYTAWMNGKNPYFTIANPNPEETNKRFIRVTAIKYFGGLYKDIKHRVKRADDNS